MKRDSFCTWLFCRDTWKHFDAIKEENSSIITTDKSATWANNVLMSFNLCLNEKDIEYIELEQKSVLIESRFVTLIYLKLSLFCLSFFVMKLNVQFFNCLLKLIPNCWIWTSFCGISIQQLALYLRFFEVPNEWDAKWNLSTLSVLRKTRFSNHKQCWFFSEFSNNQFFLSMTWHG